MESGEMNNLIDIVLYKTRKMVRGIRLWGIWVLAIDKDEFNDGWRIQLQK